MAKSPRNYETGARRSGSSQARPRAVRVSPRWPPASGGRSWGRSLKARPHRPGGWQSRSEVTGAAQVKFRDCGGQGDGGLHGFPAGHRIGCELERNLRIKPRRRIKRDKPDEFSVPFPRQVILWVDCFTARPREYRVVYGVRVADLRLMAAHLGDGRPFRPLSVLDDINREGRGIEGAFSRPARRMVRSFQRLHRAAAMLLRC